MANRRAKTLAAASLTLAEIEPLTKNQVNAFESENNLVLHGIAGTGKTFISCYLAFSAAFNSALLGLPRFFFSTGYSSSSSVSSSILSGHDFWTHILISLRVYGSVL